MSRRTQNSWLLHPGAGRALPPRNVPVFFVALAKESTGPKRDRRFPCQRANALSGPTRLPSAQVWQDGSAFALYGVAPNIEAAVEAAGRAPLVVLSPTEGTELAVRLLAQETLQQQTARTASSCPAANCGASSRRAGPPSRH